MKALLLQRVVLQMIICSLAIVTLGADTPATNSVPAQTENLKQPNTLAELLALPPDQLEKVDIARIDLLCAEGLPGAENLDVEKSLQTLDIWARYVKSETERNFHRFTEHPEKFKYSLGRYRMAVMAAVFSQDLRVQYNRTGKRKFATLMLSPTASRMATLSGHSFPIQATLSFTACFRKNAMEPALRCPTCMWPSVEGSATRCRSL